MSKRDALCWPSCSEKSTTTQKSKVHVYTSIIPLQVKNFSTSVLLRLKIIKKSGFRRGVITNESKRALETEKMLSPLEWFNLFSETCKGLLKLATPSSHYKLTYFIYCAVVTTRFTGSLEKVRGRHSGCVVGYVVVGWLGMWWLGMWWLWSMGYVVDDVSIISLSPSIYSLLFIFLSR